MRYLCPKVFTSCDPGELKLWVIGLEKKILGIRRVADYAQGIYIN
jgi:hypothetical protein